MTARTDMLIGAHFDDDTGDSVALDYVRDTVAPTAAKTGAPTIALGGKFDAALLLDAAEYVEYSGQEFLNALGDEGTVEFWVKPGYSGSPGTQQTYVYLVESGGYVDRVSIWHTASGFLQLYINGSAGTVIGSISQSWSPTAGTWYHIAAAWVDATVRLYVDGVELDESALSGARAGSANYLTIGYDASSSVAQDYMLDELAIFDTALYVTGFTPPTAPWDTTPATLDNGSFEIAATQNGVDIEPLPAGWDITTAAVEFAAATFGPPRYTVEMFGALWMDNEDALDELTPSDLDAAQFGADPITVYESFETQWMDNEDAIDELTSDYLVAAKFGSATDEYESFEAEWPARHPVADARWITATAVSSDPSAVHARLNLIKSTYSAHIADDTVHTAADTTNTIEAADATDLATSIALATELWTDCWVHMLDVAVDYHLAYSGQLMKKPTLSGAIYPPTTYSHCATIALLLTIYADLHFTWLDNTGPGLLEEYDWTLANIFAYPVPTVWAGGGSTESFETLWMGNQDAIDEFAPANLEATNFVADTTPEMFESFEAEIDLEIIASSDSSGMPEDIDPTGRVRVTISGTFVADLVLRARVEGSTTWEDLDATSAPGDIDVPEGYVAIRMYTDTYTSGSPAAVWKWGPMETR